MKKQNTLSDKKLEIRYLPAKALLPYAKNARTHSEEQIEIIRRSLVEFGWTNPVLLDGKKGIIAGHGRLIAAVRIWEAGETIKRCPKGQAPCIDLHGLTAAQKKAYVIADNQTAIRADWDFGLLGAEIGELKLEGFDVSLLGFNDSDLSKFLADEGTVGLTDEDAVPDVQPDPITKPGDVWLLGKHRLMCGDSTSIDAVETLMDGDKASLVVTDPPWNVAYGTNLANNAQGYKAREIMNDNFSTDKEWVEFLTGVMSCINAVTLAGCPLYCVMGPSEWPAIDKALREAGFHWSSTIIWAKDQLVMSRKDYHTQYEPIWYGWKEGAARIWVVKDRKQSDLWQCARPKNSPLHPTTKPVELIERAVLNSSNHGVVVFEPFGGSGSTLIACEKSGRTNRSMELDPKYVDVIVRRWQEFTGKAATLEMDGRTFADVESARQPTRALHKSESV